MSRLIDAKEKLVNLADSGMPKAYRHILMAGFRRIDELERLLHDIAEAADNEAASMSGPGAPARTKRAIARIGKMLGDGG